MFRIDREYVSYAKGDQLEGVYTTINSTPKPAPTAEEVGEALKKAEADAERLLSEARQRAEGVLAQAQAEAQALLKQAGSEAEAFYETARQQGYEEGRSLGKQEAERAVQEVTDKKIVEIHQILKKIEDQRKAVIDSLEGEIIELVLKISEKVINVQLEKDDKTFVEIIQAGIDRLKSSGRLFLRVSPEEYSRICSIGLSEFIIDPETSGISPVQEPHFNRWDCVLENEEETLDAGVNSQLRRIALAFRSQVSEGL